MKGKTAFFLVPLLLFWAAKAQAGFQPLSCLEERQHADSAFKRIENEWPLRGSADAVTQYVQKLGVRLAHVRTYGQYIPWQFFIVRNLAPNAYSIGGGYVFVTEGAISLAQNESELAAILAHEIGHELAGHFCENSAISDIGGLFDIFSVPENQQYRAGIGSMTQIIDPVKEQQADRIALSILRAGGYDPRAMLEAARRLPMGNTGPPMDSHRLQSLESSLAKMPPVKVRDSDDFRTIKRILADERAAW